MIKTLFFFHVLLKPQRFYSYLVAEKSMGQWVELAFTGWKRYVKCSVPLSSQVRRQRVDFLKMHFLRTGFERGIV